MKKGKQLKLKKLGKTTYNEKKRKPNNFDIHFSYQTIG